MIIIEGIIGSGKTTLAGLIHERIPRSFLYQEPVQSNPYLERFYKDMRRWGLEMQYYLMARRYLMHVEAVKLEWSEGLTTIFDRSIYGDRAFADVLHQDGLIDDLGYESYMLHRACMQRQLLTPQSVIFLDVDVEATALKRIGKRGRACEVGIPGSYLKSLAKAYEPILKELEKMGSHVYRIDWNQEGIDWRKIPAEVWKNCEFTEKIPKQSLLKE